MLFHDWQNGTNDIDFGDHKAFLDGAKLYKAPYDVSGIGKIYDVTETGCINADCMDVAEHLIDKGYNPAILNLASAVAPLFRIVMEESEFKNKFKLLVFAMLERPRRPQGPDGHFAPFYCEFGTYTIE